MTAEIVGFSADSSSRTSGSVGFSCELLVLMAFITYMSSCHPPLLFRGCSARQDLKAIGSAHLHFYGQKYFYIRWNSYTDLVSKLI